MKTSWPLLNQRTNPSQLLIPCVLEIQLCCVSGHVIKWALIPDISIRRASSSPLVEKKHINLSVTSAGMFLRSARGFNDLCSCTNCVGLSSISVFGSYLCNDCPRPVFPWLTQVLILNNHLETLEMETLCFALQCTSSWLCFDSCALFCFLSLRIAVIWTAIAEGIIYPCYLVSDYFEQWWGIWKPFPALHFASWALWGPDAFAAAWMESTPCSLSHRAGDPESHLTSSWLHLTLVVMTENDNCICLS